MRGTRHRSFEFTRRLAEKIDRVVEIISKQIRAINTIKLTIKRATLYRCGGARCLIVPGERYRRIYLSTIINRGCHRA